MKNIYKPACSNIIRYSVYPFSVSVCHLYSYCCCMYVSVVFLQPAAGDGPEDREGVEADATEWSGQREGHGGSAQHRGAADQRTKKGKKRKRKKRTMYILHSVFYYMCMAVYARWPNIVKYDTCPLLYFYVFPGVPSSARWKHSAEDHLWGPRTSSRGTRLQTKRVCML